MSKGVCTFRKRDVKEALKAAREAGISIARFEIGKDGKIVIVAGKPDGVSDKTTANPWDEVLDHERH